jgi:hypothetical protein
MSEATIEQLKDAIEAEDHEGVLSVVRGLPRDLLPEARKLVETIPDRDHARQAILAVDDRADTLGVALGA